MGRSPNIGAVLQCNRRVNLSRPLFDSFPELTDTAGGGGSVDDDGGDAKPRVVHEQLSGGWCKKAVRREKGERRGHWDIYLISPDKKIIRTAKDLKIFVAKTGAVIDENSVNFGLPKETSEADKGDKAMKDSE